MIIRRKFGSVFLNGNAVKPGTWVDPAIEIKSLSIGSTEKTKGIQWILVNGMFIADRCILTGVSWDELDANDLVFSGKKILLDESLYQVRLLKVGRHEWDPNEWDDALNNVGNESNEIWHWKNQIFWGQELDSFKIHRIIRGNSHARDYGCCKSDNKSPRLGWRPVLIPDVVKKIGPDQIGTRLQLWGKTGEIIIGRLVNITDYDFLLEDAIRVAASAPGVPCISKRWPNKKAAIEKSGLVLAQKCLITG